MSNRPAFVRQAKWVAQYAHQHQTRKNSSTPYIIHPARVAAKLRQNPYLEAAGWLHDVIEDCGWTAGDLLRYGIPTATVETVVHVTQRKGVETYRQYVRRVAQAGSWAIAVKLADLADNLQDVGSLPAGEAKGLTQRWLASRATLLSVGADLSGLLRLSE